MLRRHAVVTVVMVVLASCLLWGGTASAHSGEVVDANCSSVSGTFEGFHPEDHPISFAVSVDGAEFQTVTTIESPPGFLGSGTASADVSSLTGSVVDGTIATYAVWPDGQSATTTVSISCAAPPTTSPPTTTTTSPPSTTVPPERVIETGTLSTPPIVAIAAPPPAVAMPVQPATAG